jgi:cardiolipin synthase
MTNSTQQTDTKEQTKLIQPLTLIKGGTDYFDELVHLISHARKSIYLLTYIFQDDHIGSKIAMELKRAAGRGVNVYVKTDGYASSGLKKRHHHTFKQEKIQVRFFNPLLHTRRFYFGRRLHAKVVVADGNTALVGGMNIADRYNDSTDSPAWLDYAVNVKGQTALQIESICRAYFQHECLTNEITETNLTTPVKVRVNDWCYHRDEVSNTYLQLLSKANKEITILCSYFIPGKIVRREIRRATQRGIKMEVIMASVSDVALAKYAERWLYDWLLRNKVRIFEYKPTVLHGKMAVADKRYATIGSYNVNNISAYAAVEMNLQVDDKEFAEKVFDEMTTIKKNNCMEIDGLYHKNHRTALKQLARWASYHLYRLIFLLTTFYYKQKN